MSEKAAEKANTVPCGFCGKSDPPHNPEFQATGTNLGDSGVLGSNIMEKAYPPRKKIAREHPLSIKEQGDEFDCAQAHHLICSESMRKDDDWARICKSFGYNINCKENGVFLPADMRIACHLKIPLHRGNHSATETGESMNYVDGVKNMIKPVKDLAVEGDYCSAEKEIIANLNEISSDIWNLIKSFAWTLTYDGRDYIAGGIGCLGATGLRKKRKLNPSVAKCLSERNHGITIIGDYFVEQ